jgi:hypothetical protein
MPAQPATLQRREPPMQKIESGDAPYQFWHRPGLLSGTFEITNAESAEEVRRAVNAWIDAWKLLQQPSGSARRPADEEKAG